MDTLVTTEWLNRHLNEPDIVILDCRVHTERTETGMRNSSGRADYLGGHIPSAGFADLKGDLCDNSEPVEFALPDPETLCAAMGGLGVGDGSRVVLYDDMFSAWAARVWWMLRWVGFDRAAILDGGLNAWKAEGRSLSVGPVSREAKCLTSHPRPELIADRDEVLAAIDDASVNLIDAMPATSFQGEMALYGRPGHIPTAVNICGTDLLDDTGHFRPLAELDAMHKLDRDARAITYCGGGILASSNAFAMTRLGFRDVAVYTPSLQEWAANPDNPMTVEAG
jgi:thiosulfate/3-mercaptopyruvate sulfurtransferase